MPQNPSKHRFVEPKFALIFLKFLGLRNEVWALDEVEEYTTAIRELRCAFRENILVFFGQRKLLSIIQDVIACNRVDCFSWNSIPAKYLLTFVPSEFIVQLRSAFQWSLPFSLIAATEIYKTSYEIRTSLQLAIELGGMLDSVDKVSQCLCLIQKQEKSFFSNIVFCSLLSQESTVEFWKGEEVLGFNSFEMLGSSLFDIILPHENNEINILKEKFSHISLGNTSYIINYNKNVTKYGEIINMYWANIYVENGFLKNKVLCFGSTDASKLKICLFDIVNKLKLISK